MLESAPEVKQNEIHKENLKPALVARRAKDKGGHAASLPGSEVTFLQENNFPS